MPGICCLEIDSDLRPARRRTTRFQLTDSELARLLGQPAAMPSCLVAEFASMVSRRRTRATAHARRRHATTHNAG